MTWWARLVRVLTGGVKQRVTRLGFFYAAVCVGVGAGAFVSGNNLLFLILATLLAALVISGFVSRLSLAGLSVDIRLPEHVSARLPALAQLTLKNEKKWSPSFSIHVRGSQSSGFQDQFHFAVIPGGSTVEQPLTLLFPRRGQYRDDSLVFSTRFPFGFTERHVQVAIERDVIVYPSIEGRPEFHRMLAALDGEAGRQSHGRGDEFQRIRPYEFNESARYVDWRATAHTRRLQVREYRRQEQPRVELVLDLNVPPEHWGWFEETVEGCAYLVWSLHQRRTPVRLRSQSFDLQSGGDAEAASVYDMLRVLALVSPLQRPAPLLLDDDPDPLRIVFRAPDSGAKPNDTGAREDGDHSHRERISGDPGIRDRPWGANAAPDSRRQH